MIGISACLLGFCCRYDGNSKCDNKVLDLIKNRNDFFFFCPEQMGGLSTPRTPSEIRNGKVISSDGEDRTSNFVSGAYETIKAMKLFSAHSLILKEKSPSCAVSRIYDGLFSGRVIQGNGILTEMLKKEGIDYSIDQDMSNENYTWIILKKYR